MTSIAMIDHVRRTPWGRALVRWPLLRTATLATAAALLSGCVINLDGSAPGAGTGSGSSNMGSGSSNMGSGSSMDMSPTQVHRLPPPSIGAFEPWVLDAEAQKRFDEVAQYLWDRYQAAGWQILLTVATPRNDVIDWLSADSVEGSLEEPPPTPEDTQLPDGVQRSLTDLDLFPWLRGPEGSVPVLRPNFAAYVFGFSGATSLEDYLQNHVVPGAPDGNNRLYAGITLDAPNLGAVASVNAFSGEIYYGDMSLIEMTVGCRKPGTGEMWQYIGIAASRDWTAKPEDPIPQFSASFMRLQVEFFTAGTSQGALGHNKGGWVGTANGFTPRAGSLYPIGLEISASTIDGPQYEHLFWIRLWNGNWWVGFNGFWLGYFPGTLFGEGEKNLLASKACTVKWYGEVYDPRHTPTKWTETDMASGAFAAAGFGKAGHLRNPFYIDPSGVSQWPTEAVPIHSQSPSLYNPACYTLMGPITLPPLWNYSYYLGGPGGNALSKDCPTPEQP